MVSGYKQRDKGSKFADLLTHYSRTHWDVAEVKRYLGPQTTIDVEAQLQGYFAMLATRIQSSGRGVGPQIFLDKDSQFMEAGEGTGVIGVFKAPPDWRGEQDDDPYVVWSPEPGPIYFDNMDRMRNRA